MNRQDYIYHITKYFAYLLCEINTQNSFGLFDINSIAEDFYLPILKIVFDCPELENKNVIKYNYPAIDLGCEKSRKSFQVTSTNTSPKIMHTLEKFREHDLHEKYDEVYIFIIKKKQKTYSAKPLEEEILRQSINFNKDIHIMDENDLRSKIKSLNTEKLKVIYDLLKVEFDKNDNFSSCRDELDNILSISDAKIQNEKDSKKYIPSVFAETTEIKDLVRLFAHPLFFYRKIEDKILSLNRKYKGLDEYLSMMDAGSINFEAPNLIEENDPKTIQDTFTYLDQLQKTIVLEKEKVAIYSPWGKEPTPDFDVPAEKEVIKSLLRLKRESVCYSIEQDCDKILEFIKLCKAQIFLVTSMAGQGKTNFVCDLIEKQFKPFEIPSIFIPARELNSYSAPTIFKHITDNKYLSGISNQYTLLETFDAVAKSINRPFIIAIDGINEVKDLDRFNHELDTFLSAVIQYNFVKIIITCRSEFFEQRFSSLLNQPFSDSMYHVSDLKANMSEENLERALKAYLIHFNISVNLGESARIFLKSDLLLLRIFCELNQNKDIGKIDEVYKDQLYEEYLFARIESFDKSLQRKVMPTLMAIAGQMVFNDEYSTLLLKDFDDEQIRIIDQLISEDIILKRDLPIKTLGTVGNEAVAFTYDELRDFIIAYYLITELFKSDFVEFNNFFQKLPKLPAHEGVFKYLYILSKKDNIEKILSLCEETEDFDENYSNILLSMPPEYQTENDIKLVTEIISKNSSKDAVCNICLYLYNHRKESEALNIRLLIEHINKIGDAEFDDLMVSMFSKGYFSALESQKHIDSYVENWCKAIVSDTYDSIDEVFIFWLQVAAKSNYWVILNVVEICSGMAEEGKRQNCFQYIETAKSSKVQSLLFRIMA